MNKITNGDKFKTAEERQSNFNKFCNQYVRCHHCPLGHSSRLGICRFKWLDFEYMEALKPCPFCGGEAEHSFRYTKNYSYSVVGCKQCDAITKLCKTENEAIAAWNRRV